ncbi:hypothetical protein C8J34_104140 [Rhizobium sp. PP-F2F-G36]|nr:hypothetical protein C8J34_104140 [Rhizobium sp. PP-F2F-G36]
MLPSSLTHTLSIAADPVIANVLAYGGARTGKPSGEVSAVRTITLDGFDEIAAAWSPILRSFGYRIDLRAVFCHSRPHVTFAPVPHPNHPGGKTPRRCELADLLIVIDHVDRSQKIDDRHAVLVQAKMLKSGSLKLSGGEWVQHELLAWLPAFTFVDPGHDPRSRDLNGTPLVGSPAHTTEYGGIDLKGSRPEWLHQLTQKTAPWFNSPVSLADYMARMATGNSVCSRKALRGGLDDWSFTVDELLRVTAARPITKKSGVARGNDNVVGFIADTSSLAGADDGGGDYVEGDMPEWPEGPISTIHMTLGSIDERP